MTHRGGISSFEMIARSERALAAADAAAAAAAVAAAAAARACSPLPLLRRR
jgi:hypothetical protein